MGTVIDLASARDVSALKYTLEHCDELIEQYTAAIKRLEADVLRLQELKLAAKRNLARLTHA